jgi:Xaa-Pro dipeptidase
MNDRIQKVSGWMKTSNIQLCFITNPDNVFYFSGFLSEPHERLLAIAIFQEEEPFLICPAMEKDDAKRAGWSGEIIGHSDTDHPWEIIQKAIEKRNLSLEKVAIEKEHMNVERYEAISNLFPHATFVPAEEKVRTLRLVKDSSELKILREACELADYAIEIGVQEIKEGKSELDVLAAIEYALKKKGVNEMSFSTMVLTGVNAASPHGTPGLTKIKKGDFVLFDLGVVVDGYCSDITRTVAFGEVNDQKREIYETVRKAQLAALEASQPGKTCAEIDLAARSIIREAGYGDYFPHRLGHGLGISVHEFPSLTETNQLLLEEGMVYTIEPGIYVPNVAGVRIEDDVYVTKDGVEILTKFPKELIII